MAYTYTYYRENCALCGDLRPKQDMNQLKLSNSGEINRDFRKLCHVCDNCLPKLLDFLEVPEPEKTETRPYTPARYCRKCYYTVGKTARFCPYCGDELDSQKKEL